VPTWFTETRTRGPPSPARTTLFYPGCTFLEESAPRTQGAQKYLQCVPQPAALLKVNFAVKTINKNCLSKYTKKNKIRALLSFVNLRLVGI
jgi:hypothetical protein